MLNITLIRAVTVDTLVSVNTTLKFLECVSDNANVIFYANLVPRVIRVLRDMGTRLHATTLDSMLS